MVPSLAILCTTTCMIRAALVVTRGSGQAKGRPFVRTRHLLSYISDEITRRLVVETTQNDWTDNDTGLEWLQHFGIVIIIIKSFTSAYTRARQKGQYWMLVLDGHESHIDAGFNEYLKENGIIPLCTWPSRLTLVFLARLAARSCALPGPMSRTSPKTTLSPRSGPPLRRLSLI